MENLQRTLSCLYVMVIHGTISNLYGLKKKTDTRRASAWAAHLPACHAQLPLILKTKGEFFLFKS